VPFTKFADDYNLHKQMQESLVAETVSQSSGKDFSGLQILAVLGIAVGIYFLIKKDK